MIARVSGTRRVTTVPRPSSLSMVTDPRSASTFLRTTSMPTPRPEISGTHSALALGEGPEQDPPGRAPPPRPPHLRRLDPVVDGVADHVGERVADHLDDGG